MPQFTDAVVKRVAFNRSILKTPNPHINTFYQGLHLEDLLMPLKLNIPFLPYVGDHCRQCYLPH